MLQVAASEIPKQATQLYPRKGLDYRFGCRKFKQELFKHICLDTDSPMEVCRSVLKRSCEPRSNFAKRVNHQDTCNSLRSQVTECR